MSTTGIIFLVLSYLIGSIPTAVWISKFFYKIDIRDYGSGNPGATNTFRILGKRAGLTILLLDIFKGWIVVTLACYVSQAPPHTQDFVNLHISFGVASVLGHVFPIYIGFKGGKGIATLFGVVLAIHPYACLMLNGVFLIVFLLTHYVSLSSICAGISFPFILIFIYGNNIVPSMVIFSCFVALLVLVTHQKNIERLLRKQESKIFIFKKNGNGPTQSS